MIILAAGQGTRLRPLTDERPKCMVEVEGRSLLEWQLIAARDAGVRNIAVVRGYMKESINFPGVTYLENPFYETTNMVETLWCAESLFDDSFIVSYGDIIYESTVLERFMQEKHDIGVAVDQGWLSYWERRFDNVLDDSETLEVDCSGRIISIGQKPERVQQIQGQYMGLTAFRGAGVDALRSVYAHAKTENSKGRNPLRGQRPFAKLYMTDLLQGIIDSGFPIHQVLIQRGWLEIDTLRDLYVAEQSIEIDNGRFTVTH
jgi:choline kinase